MTPQQLYDLVVDLESAQTPFVLLDALRENRVWAT